MRFIDNKAYVKVSVNLADQIAKVSKNFAENQELRLSPWAFGSGFLARVSKIDSSVMNPTQTP